MTLHFSGKMTGKGLRAFTAYPPNEQQLAFQTATWDPATLTGFGNLSNGDKTVVHNNGYGAVRATTGISSGKLYWEITSYAGWQSIMVGAIRSDVLYNNTNQTWNAPNTMLIHGGGGAYGSGQAYSVSSYNPGETLGFALDMDVGAMWVHKNGIWGNGATSAEIDQGNITNAYNWNKTGTWYPAVADSTASTTNWTCAIRTTSFAYSPPESYVA